MKRPSSPRSNAARGSPIPVYALYGQQGDDLVPDVLHYETIRERSQTHDWTIRPHRHQELGQIFLFRSGRSEILLDGRRFPSNPPSVLYLPPLAVHGFDMDPATDGAVITVPAATLGRILEGAQAAQALIHAPAVVHGSLSRARASDFTELFGRVEREFRAHHPDRPFALASLVGLIMLRLARIGRGADTGVLSGETAQAAWARRFRKLVDAHYAHGWSVEDYARRLGVSAARLTRTCREVLATPPYRLVLERAMLEAKRDLVYTSKTIGEIARGLGYDDIAYFSRFFARETGRTPSRYRSEARDGLRGA